jgi:hypothetical protein
MTSGDAACEFWLTIAPAIGHVLIAVAALVGAYAASLRHRQHVARLELEAIARDDGLK